jgi:uncharacterized protein (TIGR03118 family)
MDVWLWYVLAAVILIIVGVVATIVINFVGQKQGPRAVTGATGGAGATGYSSANDCVQMGYERVYLRTSLTGSAPTPVDPLLINPWGVAYDTMASEQMDADVLWLVNAGSGSMQQYKYTLPTGGPPRLELLLTVFTTVSGPPELVGIDINMNENPNAFPMSSGGHTGPAFILTCSETQIFAYNPIVSSDLIVVLDRSSDPHPPDWNGLAIGTNSTFYIPDGKNAVVDQYDSNYNLLQTFTDPSTVLTVENALAPYNLRIMNNLLYVTFAAFNQFGDAIGMSFVDIFNLDGTFNKRFGIAGYFDQSWGLERVPASISITGNDEILIGNFGGVGQIVEYKESDAQFLNLLSNKYCVPRAINGLWAIQLLPRAQPYGQLFVTQGPFSETVGLLAVLIPTRQH